MTDKRIPIIEPYRTIRLSLCAITNWHLPSAVLLDYFVSIEHALDEARGQGEAVGPWREISSAYGALVMVYKPSRETVIAALRQLMALGFIEPHPNNASNKGGHALRNRYRLRSTNVREAIYAFRATAYAGDATVEIPTVAASTVGNPTVQVSEIRQFNCSISDSSTVGNPTQDLVVDLENESAAAAALTAPPLPLIDSTKTIEAWLGRKPTGLETDLLARLTAKHGSVAVNAAIEDATYKGGRTIKYVAAILNNSNPRQPAPARRPAFVAPDEPEDGPRMTAEAMRTLRREIEARRRLEGGEA